MFTYFMESKTRKKVDYGDTGTNVRQYGSTSCVSASLVVVHTITGEQSFHGAFMSARYILPCRGAHWARS